MKQAFFAGILLTFFSFAAFSQANSNYKFGTTGSNVIAYKQGTSCTASPYNFYLINDAGVQASTPFYTLANTSREVNGIGINPVDRFLYGVEYDRDAACAFSNFHLKRYDAQGNSDDLGTLPAPAGGTVTAALGCLTNNGNFVYSAKDAAGNSLVCIVGNIASLPANASATLAIASSKQIANNAAGFSYADWAVHPSNGLIYSYGIANVGGTSTGKLLVLDPATGLLQNTGVTDVTNFLDPVRDNFGGIYFGADGFLYGVNVNTRRLYRMNVVTGAASYVSTMAGSGQIRADMGSYTTGWIVLPVKFTAASIAEKGEGTVLNWSVANAADVKEFVVEQNNGAGFKDAQTVWVTEANVLQYWVRIASGTASHYRIRAVGNDGKVVYSPVVTNTVKSNGSLRLLSNPLVGNAVRFVPSFTATAGYQIVGGNGQVLKSGTVACAKGIMAEIDVRDLRSGIYFLRLGNEMTVGFVMA